jgi:hypothetical protein
MGHLYHGALLNNQRVFFHGDGGGDVEIPQKIEMKLIFIAFHSHIMK